MRKQSRLVAVSLVLAMVHGATAAGAEEKPVGITSELMSVLVKHDGRTVVIERNQDNGATVNPDFALTSRPCPPFCIQPATIAPGVDTVGELETLDYLRRLSEGDDSVLVVDSRTPDWVARGTIPGAVNIPWTKLNPALGANPIEIAEILQNEFNVAESEGLLDFSQAKTIVLFCNGMWCGQSPNNIRTLLRFGYPAHKIKWYRGGMQDWEVLGLTVVKPTVK